MSSFPLDYGKFDFVGDKYTLKLLPISNVTAFSTFSDETVGVSEPPAIDPHIDWVITSFTGTGNFAIINSTNDKIIGFTNWSVDLNTTMGLLVISVNTNTPNGVPNPIIFPDPFDNSTGFTAAWNSGLQKFTITSPSGSGSFWNGKTIDFEKDNGVLVITPSPAQTFSGGVTTRYFTKEFRYSKNGGTYTTFVALTNGALAAISIIATDVILMEIRYTRTGSGTDGSIRWIRFILDNITIVPCLTLRISQTIYNSVYGSVVKYNSIVSAVSKFSDWSLTNYNLSVYLIDDVSIPDQQIYLDRTGSCTAIDMNDVMKTPWGKKFIDMFNKLNINVFSGIRS